MSKIEKLIKELCPNGIIFKTIGEICETITDYVAAGSFKDLSNNVKYLKEPDYAMLIRTTDIKSNFKGDKFIYINEAAFNYLWRVNLDKESIVLPNIGNCGEVYYLTPNDLPYKRCALATNSILVRSKQVNMKYLKHIFLAKDFQIQLKKIISPSGQTKFNKTDLKKLKIPVPPLEVQEEIVRILDKFGELETELEAELEARKSQYEFWRDKLLNNNMQKFYIKDICINISSGGTPSTRNPDYYNGNIPWLRTQEINWNSIKDTEIKITNEAVLNSSAKLIPKNCVIIAMYGATVGKSAFNNIPLTTNQACCNLEINSNLANYKYVFYWFLNKYKYIKSLGQGSQTNINSQIIKNLVIELPSLQEQEKIVNILDKFNKLVNDISEGLPAEIEARRKQYEYYRNKLLSFEELVVNE